MRGSGLWSRVLPRSSHARAPAPVLRSFFTFSLPSAKTQLPSRSFTQNTLFPFGASRSVFYRRFRSLRFKSDKASPSQSNGASEAPLTLSQRMKKLSREYGWSALGIYFALSALDFPFCFLAVRALGTERIGHYEHVVVDAVKNTFGLQKNKSNEGDSAAEAVAREGGDLGLAEGIEEADAANRGAGASLWTELALAYAIHKSFIFLRVPATVAITPKVVKTLRKWGYDLGTKRKPKSS